MGETLAGPHARPRANPTTARAPACMYPRTRPTCNDTNGGYGTLASAPRRHLPLPLPVRLSGPGSYHVLLRPVLLNQLAVVPCVCPTFN